MPFRTHATVSDVAAAEIAALREQGVNLSPGEIVLLNALGHEIETPENVATLARGCPVPVGGVVLWPFTLRGNDWFRRWSGAGNIHWQTFALAYALAHGRDELPEADVSKAVTAWANKLSCTRQELVEAISAAVEQDETIEGVAGILDHPTGKRETNAGDISMTVAALAGGDPEMWERQCSIGYVLRLIETILAQNRADEKTARHDRKLRILRVIAQVVERIKKRASANG